MWILISLYIGNCYMNDIEHTFDMKDTADHHQLQFFHDIVFVVQSNSSVINVWKYVEDKSSLEFLIESTERSNNGHITLLRFIEGSSNSSLVAGYSNGGFTVWEVFGSCFEELRVKESVSYMPSDITIDDKVTAIALEYPMIVICTESMTLSVFYINVHLSLEMVHCLHNPIDCSSIVIDIKKRIPKTNEKRQSKEDVWQAIVCFGMFGGGGLAASVGIQVNYYCPLGFKIIIILILSFFLYLGAEFIKEQAAFIEIWVRFGLCIFEQYCGVI